MRGDFPRRPDDARAETVPAWSILGAVEDAFDEAEGAKRLRPRITHPSMAGKVRADSTEANPPAAGNLSSPDPHQRRAAVTRLAAAPGDGARAERLARALLLDPDPAIRAEAAAALAAGAGPIALEVIERGLADSDDRVRAASVGVARRAGAAATRLVAPLLADRRWPLAQRAALEVLPQFLGHAVADADLLAVLQAVARMDPPPLWSERHALASVAGAIGGVRLAVELEGDPTARLGAARLLALLADRPSRMALAALAEDPVEEIRRLAAAAGGLLAGSQEDAEAAASWEEGAPTEAGAELEDEMMSALARALSDPEEEVRSAAKRALSALSREATEEWARRALQGDRPEVANSAATIAETLGLGSVAVAMLERAALTPPARRAPYLTALAGLGLAAADLAALVDDVDPASRQEAVRIVWQTGGAAVLPGLRALLQHSSGSVRMAVLEVLAESGDPGGMDVALSKLAEDASAAVRAAAVHALARAPHEVRREALRLALEDPDPDVRATAVDVLANGIAPQVTDLVLRAYEDDDERVWRAAVHHLATFTGRELPQVWAALLRSDDHRRRELTSAIEAAGGDRLVLLATRHAGAGDATERSLAVELAARAGTAGSAGVVVGALEDPEASVRRAAASALRILRTPSAVAALTHVLTDPHPEVRIEATRALGLIDDDSVPESLISALRDPELRVRNMAAEALLRWQSPTVARRLCHALAVPDLREAASGVLESMGRAAVEPLVAAVRGPDAEVAAAAAGVLARVAGSDVFVQDLASTDADARLRAVEVLGAMGGPGTVDALLSVISDPHVGVRRRAVELLAWLGDARAVRPLRQVFLSDPVPEVAAAAELALRRLESTPDLPGEARGFDP